jgi:steroid 5-alpha reductase family enzyme
MASPITDWNLVLPHVEAAAKEALQTFPLPYATSGALAVSFQMLFVAVFFCWLASVLTRNYSFTDRIWSITPFLFVWHFAYKAFLEDAKLDDRLAIMVVLSTLWGLRLTFNFARKGGYSLSEEDYRWAVLRKHMNPVLYQIFNVVFIAGYQNVLVYLIVLPAYVAYVHRVPVTEADWIASGLFLALLLLETVADQQQWNFYKQKYALIAKKQQLTGDFKVGFNRSGLFRYSRHPNFFAEFSQWCVFYVFAVTSSGVALNPTIIGAVLLVLLFQGSAMFTEWITASKYPEYKVYQTQVSRLVPWFSQVGSSKKRVD